MVFNRWHNTQLFSSWYGMKYAFKKLEEGIVIFSLRLGFSRYTVTLDLFLVASIWAIHEKFSYGLWTEHEYIISLRLLCLCIKRVYPTLSLKPPWCMSNINLSIHCKNNTCDKLYSTCYLEMCNIKIETIAFAFQHFNFNTAFLKCVKFIQIVEKVFPKPAKNSANRETLL